MKRIMVIAALAAFSLTATADEHVTFSDGSSAWVGENGRMWGKTDAPSRPDDQGQERTIYDDRGGSYNRIGSGYINTQTGDFVPGR